MTTSPTFVARFADGTVTRMTTHCGDDGNKLDLTRGVRLARAAYESRKKQPAPALVEGHFEAGPNGKPGKVLKVYSSKELNSVSDREQT